MKKTALLIVAAGLSLAANAQVVVGLQGGYCFESSTRSWNDDHVNTTLWLGGLQAGYQATPKLYVGVMAGYRSAAADTLTVGRTLDTYLGQDNVPIEDYKSRVERSGWTLCPTVRYEVLRYGNMRFNLMLQGSLSAMGYGSRTESFVTPTINNGEYIEADPWKDSVSTFSWGVSLRPTLTYEFSEHLSAELSLDLLSVGYISSREKHDAEFHTVDGEQVADVYTTSRLYGGLNSLMETLRWESPMLRLGFNYTF